MRGRAVPARPPRSPKSAPDDDQAVISGTFHPVSTSRTVRRGDLEHDPCTA
jgi:hypothetical protein